MNINDGRGGPRQFQGLEAASLFCEKCKQAQPVRRKLLLVLPNGDKFAYYCRVCGSQVGSKMETSGEPPLWRPM